MSIDKRILDRKNELIKSVSEILEVMKRLDYEKKYEDPLVEPKIIGKAIRDGILDAPHLKGVPVAKGNILTGFREGACISIDNYGNIISEKERLSKI